MKKYLSVVLTFLLLVSTLLINDNIKYYGLLSLFRFYRRSSSVLRHPFIRLEVKNCPQW